MSPSTDLALVPVPLTWNWPQHHEREGRRRGLEEFIADLIPCDLKLVSADQSCYVLHVVNPLIKNTYADESHMLGQNEGQTSIFG